jgi:hypothetical protein
MRRASVARLSILIRIFFIMHLLFQPPGVATLRWIVQVAFLERTTHASYSLTMRYNFEEDPSRPSSEPLGAKTS